VCVEWTGLEKCWCVTGEGVWPENSLAIREVGDRVGVGQVQTQVVDDNDPHRGHGLVYEGEW
jgi:hypothetical protein